MRRSHGFRESAVILGALVLVVGLVPVTAGATTAPSAPRSLIATAGPATGAVALTWTAPSSSGGVQITDYGFDVSVNAGATWSSTTWLGSTALSASSTTVLALVCANAGGASDGNGCRYRIHANNSVGVSGASNSVTTWVLPSAPRQLAGGATDASFASVALQWLAPTTTGSFPSVTYTVLSSGDGATFAAVTTTSALVATVPCLGARSCAYRVTATNGQGTGAASKTITVATTPGRVQSLGVLTSNTDLGAGVSQLAVRWLPPTTGMAATEYRYSTCRVPAGLTGCADASASWSAPITFAAQPGLNTRIDTCSAGTASCYIRVAAVNGRGGVSAWRTVNLQPWAPFNVAVTPGPAAGEVTITFGGPAESGPNGAPKYYQAFVCTSDCGINASWHDSGLTIPYPPTGSSPFRAGTYACGGNASCQVRLQFTAGNGAKGPVTPVASAYGLVLSVTDPADGSTSNDATPNVLGTCTIGAGAVTATILPGPVTLAANCGALGTWTTAVPGPVGLTDGPYTVSAWQAGTVGPAVSNTNAFTIDTAAPVVTITSPASGATLTDPSVALSGTCSESGRTVSVTITGPPNASLTTPCVSGAWTVTQLLPNGSYSVTASQTDVAGNTGTSAPTTFTLVATAPVVTVQAPTDGAILATSQPAIAGLCTTGAGTVTVTVAGATSVTRTTSCVSGAWLLSPNSMLNNGVHTISASQTAGTVTITSVVNNFRVDTVAPVTTDNTLTLGPAWRTTNALVMLTPTDPVPGSGVAATYYTTNGTTPTTSSSQGTSFTLSADGIYTIKYFSVDNAGNVEAVKSAAALVRIDTALPNVAITFPSTAPRYNAARWNAGCPTVGICGTSSDALSGVASVGVTVQRLSDSLYWNGSAWVIGSVTLTPTGIGSWSVPLAASNLTDGLSYTVTAVASDVAGNLASAVRTFQYDAVGPHVTSIAAGNGNWAVNTGDTFTVTFDEPIDPLSVPTTGTLTFSNDGNDCNSNVTNYSISGLAAGTASTGSCGYIVGIGHTIRTVTWDGTFSVSGLQVTFTVTTGCQETGCSSSLKTSAPPSNRQGALQFTPLGTIADTAGNLVVVSTSTYCRNGVLPCGAVF